MTRALRLPRELEPSHTMIMGDPDKGKSALMRQLAYQVRQRRPKERALFYDPHGEFVSQFWEDGDHLLNPFDARTSGWDLASELPAALSPERTGAWALAIAQSLFPERPRDQAFFAENTQRVCAELLTHRPSAQTLAQWLGDPKMLAKLLKGSSSENSLAPSAPDQREGLMAELNRVTDALKTLPDLRDTSRRWSAAEWAQDGKGWVFITTTPMDRERLRPLTSLWVDLVILQLMMLKKPKDQLDWLFLAEVSTLRRLTHFYTAATEGRKYHNPMVFDIQGRSQIKALYGEFAEVLLSAAGVQIFLGTKEEAAAEWIAKMIAKNEVQWVGHSRSNGDRKNHSSERLERREEYLVLPSEIQGLPKMQGYLTMENFVVKLEFPYLELPTVTPAFIERPVSKRHANQPPADEPAVVITTTDDVTPTRYRGVTHHA